ncbi:unnamed protein product, partial [Ranitomeya imitator]
MRSSANAHRLPALTFAPGDLVWLSARNIRLRVESTKFAPRYLGPFKVLEQVNPVVYRLALPPRLGITDTFHVSLLKPVYMSRFSESSAGTSGSSTDDYEVNANLGYKVVLWWIGRALVLRTGLGSLLSTFGLRSSLLPLGVARSGEGGPGSGAFAIKASAGQQRADALGLSPALSLLSTPRVITVIKMCLERICRPADSAGALRMRPPFWKMAAPREKTARRTPGGPLTMVISKETRAAIIALQKNGLTGKSIAATKIAPQSTIYRIIKNFKERASIVVKKAPGRPRKSSKRQDRILKLFQLRDRTTSSAELAQEWQQAGGSASARTVRRRLFEQGLVSTRAAKKPLLSRKNIRDRLIFCKRYREWTAEDWGKVIFSDESPFRLLGTSGKQLIRRRRGERYHQSCLMPTVKHPETIHVWGCFSAKRIGSLTVLPKNTAMNKEWYQNVLQEQLLPTVQEQFGAQQCLFQHDGAPCHKAKVITKWLMEQNIEILGPWPGNSPDFNPIENLWLIIKRQVDKQKPTNSGKMQELIMQEWTAISQDLVQKLIESMPGRIAEVLKKKGKEIQNMMKYPEIIFATSGDDVNINCTMNFPLTPFSVFWTVECNDQKYLNDYQLYKDRLIFHFSSHQVTIQNVTVRDSGMYCCHVETADGKRQAGNGTRLEVTKKLEESICKRDTLLLVMEVVRIFFLTVLIILLCIVIKKSL